MNKRKEFSLNDISNFHATLGLWGWLKPYQFASRQNCQGLRRLFTLPCSYSTVCGAAKSETCSHHPPVPDTLQSQKCEVLVRALSSSKMLFIIIFKNPYRSRKIIVNPGLKAETEVKGDDSAANARNASQGSGFGLCSYNVPATETGMYCWISERNRKDDYKMKASLQDINNLIISIDQKGTTVQTEVHDNLIAY